MPPRGYWQRLEAGQVVERAPPPEDGQVETDILLKGSSRPIKDDPTGAMLRRRVTPAPRVAEGEECPPAKDDVAVRILDRGMRQQLREAAVAYLAGVAEAIPTLDEATAQATLGGIDAIRAALDGAGAAAGAAEALRARSAGSGRPEAWLGALVPARHSVPPPPSRRRVRRAAESGAS